MKSYASLFFSVLFFSLGATLHAKKIGTNSLGLQLGQGDLFIKLNDRTTDAAGNPNNDELPLNAKGFAFHIEGNVNLFSPEEKKIGLDLPIRYLSIQGDTSITLEGEKNDLDIKLHILQGGVRPYYKASPKYTFFADLGVVHTITDAKVIEDGASQDQFKDKGEKTAFGGGLGIEAVVGKNLLIAPTITFSKAGMISGTQTTVDNTVAPPTTTTTHIKYSDIDVVNYTIPIAYPISESLDLTITYSYSDNEDSTEQVPAEDNDDPDVISTDTSFIGIGLDYKF